MVVVQWMAGQQQQSNGNLHEWRQQQWETEMAAAQ
jgi:hypothetical protein